MSVGVNVNFGALKNQSEFWKSPGNLFLNKGTNPVNILLQALNSFGSKGTYNIRGLIIFAFLLFRGEGGGVWNEQSLDLTKLKVGVIVQ